jgi:hypothetical protein
MDLVSLLGKANLPVRLWKEKKEKKKNKKQKNHNDRSAPSAVARSLLLQTIPIIYAAMFLLFTFFFFNYNQRRKGRDAPG